MKVPFWCLVAWSVFISTGNVSAELSERRATGMAKPSQEEIETIQKSWPKVTNVQPNKFGAARSEKEMDQNGTHKKIQAAKYDDEFAAGDDGYALLALPRSVNNSLLPSFPPIGDQGNLGSCVAWGTTYYQATHEIGLANGTNNKASSRYVLSPKWTYNMINDGQDEGSSFIDAYLLLSQNGSVPIVNFPYDSNYRSWDLSVKDWIEAMSFRLKPPKAISISNMKAIKQTLNNGHVVTFGTYVYDWVYTRIAPDPNTKNRAVGQYAVSWVKGTDGPHFMTIVGYDDDIWIDINGNGRVDPGEMGAFLVANSWGAGWGNKGFMWVAYDAFLPRTQVKEWEADGRVPAAEVSGSKVYSAVAKAPHYKPELISLFQLRQSKRNEIKVVAGASLIHETKPSDYFTSGALFFQGGPYKFDGISSGAAKSSQFALDLTDLLKRNSAYQRFYLMVVDNAPGNPTGLLYYSLFDPVNSVSQHCSMNFPAVVDNGKETRSIDYVRSGAKSQQNPIVNISSPQSGETVRGYTPIMVYAQPPIERVDFYLDSAFIATDSEAPFLIFLDTEKLRNGPHTLEIEAYASSGRPIIKKNSFNIQN